MGMIQLENEVAIVQIYTMGAELRSFVDKESGIEYMWSADPKYWGKCSPILFPFVGKTRDAKVRIKEQIYPTEKHGFAKTSEFEVISEKECEAWFALESDEESLKSYPFEFRLEVGYRLEGKSLSVLWRVMNLAKETLHFSIGGHPAFHCPITDDENLTDCYIRFGNRDEITTTLISKTGLATDNKKKYKLTEGRLPVTEHLFDEDALVLEDNQVQEVALCRKDGSDYVRVTFDVPLFGVWSMPGGAPFICIEPWYGRCDHVDFEGSIEERRYGNSLEPESSWEASYQIHIG